MKRKVLFALTLMLVLTLAVSDVSFAKLLASQPEFPKKKLLVSADSVENSLGEKNIVIIDARTSGYDTSHIPGAINIKFGDYFTAGSGLLPVADLNSKLSAAGLKRSMTFVIYDNTTASFGAAGRIFWMLEYLGCRRVHVLDGGWDKWVADGRAVEATVNTLPANKFKAAVKPARKATKDSIAKKLGTEKFAIVDSRTDEEYIGWQLYGEARGGHIPCAVQIPYKWFFNSDKTVMEYSELKTMFESRGITRKKEVTAYCTVGIRSGFVYFLYRLMGYRKASNYDGSIAEWSADPSLSMEKAPNFSTIVHPSWVKALIDYHAPDSTTAPPPEYPYDRDHKYLIFETQWGSFEDMANGWADDSYLNGHIAGAIHSNSDVYENGYPRWFLLPDDQLKSAIGNMGITVDTSVVVYSNSPIFAARLWWILKYGGVEDVRLLNGGYNEWVAAGYEVETAINEPVAVTYEGTPDHGLIATTDYVETNFNNTDIILADVRTYDEYIGLVSGYSYVVNKGRIPAAIWAFNADNPDREYLDDDGTLKSYTDVRSMWEELGIQSTDLDTEFDKEVIFYCGSGYRSSLAFIYAYLMGYQNVRNYSDGWEGWSTNYIEDPDYVADPNVPGSTDGWIQDPSGRPVETGAP